MAKTKEELQAELQEEALHFVGDRHNICIDIGTGGGKTLLGLKHMAKQYHPAVAFLVLAPKTSIFNDWIAEAKKHGYEFLLEHISFSTYRSLPKQSTLYDWTYGDEWHSVTESHVEWLDSYTLNGGKIFGITGTYPKSGIKFEICERYAPRIYSYSVDEAIDNGLLNDYRIWVHLLPLSKRNTLIKTNSRTGGTWRTSEHKDYHNLSYAIDVQPNRGMKNKMRIVRMKAMQGYDTKLNYTKKILKKIDRKCLIFANSKKQAELLSEHTYHSGNKDAVNERNLDLFAKGLAYRVACVDQLSEGKNIPDLQVCVILHAYSNDRKTRQRIGRMFRLSPDKTAYIHILCYEGTQDEQWVKNSLKSYDQSKIKYYRPKHI